MCIISFLIVAILIYALNLLPKRKRMPSDKDANERLDQLNLLHLERNNKKGPHEK